MVFPHVGKDVEGGAVPDLGSQAMTTTGRSQSDATGQHRPEVPDGDADSSPDTTEADPSREISHEPADPGRPEGMRAAMARYVRTVHQAYQTTGAGHPPAVRGRMRLLTGPVTVVAAAAGNLHVIATNEELAPARGAEVAVTDEVDGLAWTLRFLDPVVLPELGLVDESGGPAPTEVRRTVGISTHLYHLVVQPGSQLTDHHAGHAGAGLAQDHLADARDYDTIRRHAGHRTRLVDEMEGAGRAGLPRAQALLAREIAPGDATVAELADAPRPDATALRKAVLAAVRPPAGAS